MQKTTLTLIAISVANLLATPLVNAATYSIASTTWTASGAAGFIGADSTISQSPVANSQIAYVSTAGGVYGVSPLALKNEGRGSENQTNGSLVQSSVFNATINDSLTLYFNFLTTDGRGYDDYGWARLVNANTHNTAAWLFTARSTNSGNGNVVPGNVLNRQTDPNLPDEIDASLNDGNTINFNVAGTHWAPLGYSSDTCWDNANTCGPSGWIKSAYTFAASGAYFLEFGVINWGDEAYDTALAFDFEGLQSANFSNITQQPPVVVPLPVSFMLMIVGTGILTMMSRNKTTR